MRKYVYILTLLSLVLSGCSNTSKSEKSEREEKNKYIYALLNSENQRSILVSSLLEIKGYWESGFFVSGTYSALSSLVITTDNDSKAGSWTGVSSFGDTVYRIIEYDNTNNYLYYQQSSNSSFNASGYGKIFWTEITTSGCQNSATKCFYYCERVFGKTSLSEAKSDTSTVDSSSPTTTGCGSFAWSQANLKSDTSVW